MSDRNADSNVHHILEKVRRQIRRRNILQGATTGLAVGCGVSTLFAIAHLAFPTVSPVWSVVSLIIGAPIGALWGSLIGVPLDAAAKTVDQYYVLKDRAITALQFSAADDDAVKRLQITDAAKHLRQVRADDCVTIQPHRRSLVAAGAMAIAAIGIVLFARTRSSDAVAAAPMPVAVDQAALLRETMLSEMEELVKDQPDAPELEVLDEKLEELIEQMERESMDERDLLATLSEMEQAISQAREAMQLDMSEAQFKNLASAMQPSDVMKAAAAAMEEGDYDKAANELENVDPSKLGDKQRRAVADNLKKFLSKLSPGQKGKLSQATQQLQEGLENKDSSQCKDGMCKLASLCKKQSNCNKIGQCMLCQLNRLSQCKSQCRGSCNNPLGTAAKKDSPSQSWGTSSTGQPNDGESTRLASQRRQEQLDGQQGDGPSESEILEAPEGEQSAARSYAAKYQKFRTQAEAVLDQEPLPLGHRETVRQYFESVRPDNEP